MDGLQEFMDPGILCEYTCEHFLRFMAFVRAQRTPSPPRHINRIPPTLCAELLGLTALKSRLKPSNNLAELLL